jgi:hypothetical protein
MIEKLNNTGASRRSILSGGAALLLLAGPGAAAAMPPDAALLSLCQQWHRANDETLRLDAICRAYPSDTQAEAQWTASLDVTDELEERMMPIQPRTPAGLVAKARVFHTAIESNRIIGEALNWDEELSAAILRDVLGLYRDLGVV